MNKLTIGFSPCPNDTFIFDALVNNKIDTGGLAFDVRLEDIETLNRLALKNTLDITKISYAVLPLLLHEYVVLGSGSALGSGVGPLLIANHPIEGDAIKNYTIAIPGEHTTAHLLFSLAFPGANKIFLRYNEIEEFVLLNKDKNVAGVIIHENRFTYPDKGLVKIMDLGEYWERKTGSPIPLGGIVGKRTLDNGLLKKVDSLTRQSIEYAFEHYPVLTEYVKQHSQEMSEHVMRNHIDLYVNDHSIHLGNKGKDAILEMLNVYKNINGGEFTSNSKVFLNHEI